MIRDDAMRLSVEDDGLVVFLYDAENGPEIERRGPLLLAGLDEASRGDPTLVELATDGLLIAFEKYQDDDTDLELVVGRPPTAAQRRRAGLEDAEPQRARLRLPSGRLRIEGYRSLSIGPDRGAGEGAEIEVAPGEYAVDLFRRDVWREDDSDANAIVVLTPRTRGWTSLPAPPFLGIAATPEDLPDWVGAWTIEDGVFVGLGRIDPELRAPVVNVSPKAEEDLGLAGGDVLRFSFKDAGEEISAVYLGQDGQAIRRLNEWRPKAPPGFYWIDWARDGDRPERDHFVLMPLGAAVETPAVGEDWVTVTMTASEDRGPGEPARE